MNKIKINVKYQNNFIKYLVENNIEYDSLIKEKENYTLIINKEDYKKISRKFDTKIIRYYGKDYYKKTIMSNKYLIISYIIGLCLLNLLTNTIFNVEINCENKEITNKLITELEKNNITKNKRIKTYKELIKIKENIKKEIKEIEWIEITRTGTKYVIDITPKIIKDTKYPNKNVNIIASKDGVIKHIVVHNGEKVKEENEYIKKGETIISGEIYKDENLIDYVEAKGEVYAEVWYLSKITVPLKYTGRIEKDNKINHYYLEFFNVKMTLLGKYNRKNKIIENECILNKPYLPFKVYREKIKNIEEIEINLTEDEAIKKGLELSEKEIMKDLSNQEHIISKNILKKEIKSSKMYIEVFYKLYENIASISDDNEKGNIYEERNS